MTEAQTCFWSRSRKRAPDVVLLYSCDEFIICLYWHVVSMGLSFCYAGSVMHIVGRPTFTSKHSIEIEVFVDMESMFKGHSKKERAVHAFFTFVSLGNKKDILTVPPLKVCLLTHKMLCRYWLFINARHSLVDLIGWNAITWVLGLSGFQFMASRFTTGKQCFLVLSWLVLNGKIIKFRMNKEILTRAGCEPATSGLTCRRTSIQRSQVQIPL